MITLRINNEFFTAIKENAFSIVAEGIREIKEWFFSSWIAAKDDDIEDLLAIGRQRIKRVLRDQPGWKKTIVYQIGMLDGIVSTYDDLFQEKREQKAMDQYVHLTLQKQGPVTKKILSKLISLDKNKEWIGHKELANEVKTSENSLSNIMKRLVTSRAVESERIGKRTNYRITSAGKRFYYEKYSERNPEDTYDFKDMYDTLIRYDTILHEIKALKRSIKALDNRHSYSSMLDASIPAYTQRLIQFIKNVPKPESLLLEAVAENNEETRNDSIIYAVDTGAICNYQEIEDSNFQPVVCNMH